MFYIRHIYTYMYAYLYIYGATHIHRCIHVCIYTYTYICCKKALITRPMLSQYTKNVIHQQQNVCLHKNVFYYIDI